MLPEPLHPVVVHFPIVLVILLPLFAPDRPQCAQREQREQHDEYDREVNDDGVKRFWQHMAILLHGFPGISWFRAARRNQTDDA